MKKFLSALVASAACATLIPAGMAMSEGRMSKRSAPKPMHSVVRILDKKASRRTLINETRGKQTRHARPWMKKAPKQDAMTGSSSSSASSGASSSAASSESSSASSTSSSASSAASSGN